MKPDFIIFGAGNYNSLGVLHAVTEVNKSAFILIVGKGKDWKNGNIIGYSKFAKNNIKEVDSPKDGVNWLIENKNDFIKGTIIYPTGDLEERELDLNYNSLAGSFIFPNCATQGMVSLLMDKKIQIELAEKSGIRVLQSQYTNSEIFSFESVTFPCMVKPLNSTSGSKGDMHVCYNRKELEKALKNSRQTKDFIVQQYIENESDLLFLGIALTDKNVIIPALVKKPGVSPTGEYTHAIVTTDVESHLQQKECVLNFIKSLNYTGPFSIEFGFAKGKNYFFEINLRNDGTSHYPLQAGVNIPMIYYDSIRGIENKISNCIVQYDMIDEVADLKRVLSQKISFANWIKSLKNAGSYRYYHTSDVNLLRAIIPMFLYRLGNKLLRIITK